MGGIPTNAYGLMRVDSPFEGVSLVELMARKEEINALANDDPEFAELLDEARDLIPRHNRMPAHRSDGRQDVEGEAAL